MPNFFDQFDNVDPTSTLPSGFQLDTEPSPSAAPSAPQQPPNFNDRWGNLPSNPFDQFDNIDPTTLLPPGFAMDDDMQSAAQPAAKSSLVDAAEQLPSGVLDAIQNLPSAGPRLMNMVGHGITAAANYIAPNSSAAKDMQVTQDQQDALAAAAQKNMPSITNVLPQPQTEAGKIARTIGEFAPAALMPGSAVRRAANVVVPAVASQSAGDAAAGLGASPDVQNAIRMAVAVAAGVGTNGVGRGTLVPTADDLRTAAQNNYNQVRQMGVTIRPQPVSNLAVGIESDLTNRGLTARNVPETYGVIRTLQNPPQGAVMTAQDFENARQELVAARQNFNNPREAVAANHAIGALDNYLSNIPQGDVISGNAQLASKLYGNARANWAAASRLDMVNGKVELGDLNASTAANGANIDNATRQAVKQLIRPNNSGQTLAERSGFNQDEMDQMNTVARGTMTGNILRYAGKLGPNGIVSDAVHGALALKTGGTSALAVSLPLKIASLLANRSTRNQADALSNMVGARSPLAQTMPVPPPTMSAIQAAALQAILSTVR